MIVEYIRYELPPELRQAFESSYARAGPLLENSRHCIAWELSRSVEEPASYVVRIEWDSQEGHEQGFRTSKDFTVFFGELRRYADYRRQMAHFALIHKRQVRMGQP
jgi:heme-degrading monooxygenase HmoA